MKFLRSLTFCALTASLPFIGVTTSAASPTTTAVQVFHLHVSFSEAFLVKGAGPKLLMIDAGVPNAGEAMEKQIRDYGFDPRDIGLVVLTHGHGDHAGSARYFHDKFQIPIAGSAYDLDKFESGKSGLTKSEGIGPWAAVFRPVSDLEFPSFTPDVLVKDKEVDIGRYGVPGKIVPMPGHTPGSLVVLTGSHLFAGDLIRGMFKPEGQGLVPDGHHLTEHVFHEDRQRAKEQLRPFEQLMGRTVETVWPTHWGPMTAQEVHTYIRNLPLLDELSSLQTRVLDEIVHKKSDLVMKCMAEDAALIPMQGGQIDKAAFIKGFIENPEVKLESIVPEDFRIVHATPAMAVMNYKETIKLVGQKDPVKGLVTVTYFRDGKSWKVVSVQGTAG